MATFAYTGRTRGGETITGERIADSMDAAVAALRREQVQVTKISPAVEKAVKLKGQVKSAMIYPIAVIVIAGVVVGVILWKVIPTFAVMFEGLGAELPLPTRIVIALSNNLVKFAPFVIPALGLAGYGFRQYYKTDAGRHAVDRIVLKMPVLWMLMRKTA